MQQVTQSMYSLEVQASAPTGQARAIPFSRPLCILGTCVFQFLRSPLKLTLGCTGQLAARDFQKGNSV